MEDPTPPRAQHVDDEFRSLLEGLRTTLPGVQLISAFLLILPFQVNFGRLSPAERIAFHVAFAGALTASVLLMAPSNHQRLRAKDKGTIVRQTPRHLQIATAITNVGSTLFAVALIAVAYLVASVVLNTAVAVGVTLVVAAVVGWSWFYLPMTWDREDR